MLEDEGFEVVGVDQLDAWEPGRGGVAVLVHLSDGESESAIVEHVALHPLIPVIAVLDRPSVPTVAQLVREGATAVLDEREEKSSVVARVVREALSGYTALPTPTVKAMAVNVPDEMDIRAWLSVEEEGWLRAMATGTRVGDLAEQTGYSERAMFRLLRRLYVRLGVTNRTEAILWASGHGLLQAAD